MSRKFIGHQSFKGRGTLSNPIGRFESVTREEVDDGWYREEEAASVIQTVEPDRAKSVITTNNSPDVGFDYSINPYRGCEHGCVYCLHGSTQVLMADGHTKALADIQVGDDIFGTECRGSYRRYTKTKVLAHWETRKPAYRITLADGTELIASGDHRFLSDRGWKFVVGAEQGRERRPFLTLNNRLLGFGSIPSAQPQCQSSEYRRGYLCGVIRGDANLGGNLHVVSIEKLAGECDLFDITTGTGDFIANGVISHNCFARPSHAYMGLSPGLDFETKLFYKDNAAQILKEELAKPKYIPKPIALGINTDGYQPVEKRLEVTRSILTVLAECRHPVTIVTKSALVLRDLDLLTDLARDRLISVMVSVTSLSADIKRTLEPRTASPQARLRIIEQLAKAEVPVGVLVAPVIPAITDHEMEGILEACAGVGATTAGYVLLRLPWEVKDLFREWLAEHYPDRAQHVMSLINQARGGKDNDPNFGTRMSGVGPYAALLRKRFEVSARKLGLNAAATRHALDTSLFHPPGPAAAQMTLGFD
jgi:DNA repair photolyase